MLGHPYAQEPALVAWFTQDARAAAACAIASGPQLLAPQMRRAVAQAAKPQRQHTADYQGQAEQQHW